jgi:hypothetical protein
VSDPGAIIHLQQWTLRERIMRWLSPAYRERQDAATHEAIRRLVDDPSLPCMIGDRLIPHGYGVAPGQESRR